MILFFKIKTDNTDGTIRLNIKKKRGQENGKGEY